MDSHDIRLGLMEAKDIELVDRKWEKIVFHIKDEDLKAHNSLRDYLENSSSWKIIYEDSTAKIYFLENDD